MGEVGAFECGCGLLNTNADTIATSVATAFAPVTSEVILTFCFEKKGVLSDPEDENSVIREITPEIYENLKKDGTVSGGMSGGGSRGGSFGGGRR